MEYVYLPLWQSPSGHRGALPNINGGFLKKIPTFLWLYIYIYIIINVTKIYNVLEIFSMKISVVLIIRIT